MKPVGFEDTNKCDNSVVAPVENGTTASQAYGKGEHFIRDGAFCTAIVAIASGATLTLNTNYIEGQIDAESILNGKILTSSDNIDNITDFGIYSWGSSYPTNSPVSGSASMIVIRYATVGIHQIVFSASYMHIRTYSSGAWSAWRRDVIYDDVTYGTLTLQSGVTGTLGNAVCYKKNGMVTLGGRITSSSTSADKAILSVPSGYRPSYRTWGFGAVYDTVRSAWVMGSVSVETNGNIAYYISSNACSQFLFQFTYPASS